MPALLAIETSTSACSVALRTIDGDISRDWLRHSDQPRTHSAALLQLIDGLLCDAALQRGDLSAVIISAGPGSFTGLRIGLAVAQGIALGLDIPLLAIDSLAVLAATAAVQLPAGGRVMAVTDARMGQYNVASYQLTAPGEPTELLAPPALHDSTTLQAAIIALGITALVGELATLGPVAPGCLALELQPNAGAMLDGGQQLWQDGNWPALAAVELLYLRGTEAWQRHQPIVPTGGQA